MFKFLTNDRFTPFTYTAIIVGIILYISYRCDWAIPEKSKIINLANILITAVSIFVGFLGVWLTLIYQSQNNDSIRMLKANPWFYELLIKYFKHSLLISIFAICLSAFIALDIYITKQIFFLFIGVHILVVLLNYRIINFLFRIIED